MLLIDNFLSTSLCQELQTSIMSLPFRDGQSSAGKLAGLKKHNLELDPQLGKPILEKLEDLIINDPRIKSYALPARLSPLIVNMYTQGMSYGNHVDSPTIGGARTDISFTLFLDEPDSYKGGSLVIERPELPFPIVTKPQQGSICLYSTGSIHRVSEVTEGRRLACVGWIQSRIQDEAKRSLVRELNHIRRVYLDKYGDDSLTILFSKNTTNLERMWSA